MAKKVCSAGVAGSVSFLVLDRDGVVYAAVRDNDKEIATQLPDMESATHWTERKLREIGERYEVD